LLKQGSTLNSEAVRDELALPHLFAQFLSSTLRILEKPEKNLSYQAINNDQNTIPLLRKMAMNDFNFLFRTSYRALRYISFNSQKRTSTVYEN